MTQRTHRRRAALPLILGSIIALVSSVLVGIIAAPTVTANGATSISAPQPRASCGSLVSRAVTRTLTFSAGDHYEDVNFSVRLYYRDCGASAYVDSLAITVDPEFNGCYDPMIGSKFVQNYKINPDVIGDWNPGEKTYECRSGVGTYAGVYENPATNRYVFASDPENVRCLKARVQVSLNNVGDPDGYTNRICIA